MLVTGGNLRHIGSQFSARIRAIDDIVYYRISEHSQWSWEGRD